MLNAHGSMLHMAGLVGPRWGRAGVWPLPLALRALGLGVAVGFYL